MSNVSIIEKRAAQFEAGFIWGAIQTTHIIGRRYVVIEYLPDRPGNAARGWRPVKQFHPYVDRDDCGCSYETLDEALLHCMAWAGEKRRGKNGDSRNAGWLVRAALRLLGARS